MLIFETRVKITETGLGTVEYNGYKYKVSKADIANISDFYVFTPIKKAVNVGDCFEVKSCSLTNYTPEGEVETLAIRIEQFDTINPESYEPLPEFRVKVNGSVMRTPRSVVRYIGPVKAPLLKATLRVFNENRKMFNILLVGYCSSVKTLESITNGSYIDCIAVLRNQSKSKKNKHLYQLNIESFEYVKKGETNND